MTDVQAVVEKVRAQLAQGGHKNIRGLGRIFKTYDSDGSRRVDSQEFFVGLNDCGCKLSKDESDTLFASLDTSGDGNVNFDEFLVAIRGDMSEARRAAVDAAFQKFDASGCGLITASDLRVSYNTASHPKVTSGEITEDEAFLEFLTNFGDKNNDGQITQTEWADYYAAVSASIDNDDHFVALMTTAWGL